MLFCNLAFPSQRQHHRSRTIVAMNPAPLAYQKAYQQAYQPVANPRATYPLHKARLALRLVATAIAVLAFILDVAGGATYNSYNYYDYYDDYPWPIAGSTAVSNQPQSQRIATDFVRLDTDRRNLECRRVHHPVREPKRDSSWCAYCSRFLDQHRPHHGRHFRHHLLRAA
jgi:hypothetical protein